MIMALNSKTFGYVRIYISQGWIQQLTELQADIVGPLIQKVGNNFSGHNI